MEWQARHVKVSPVKVRSGTAGKVRLVWDWLAEVWHGRQGGFRNG